MSFATSAAAFGIKSSAPANASAFNQRHAQQQQNNAFGQPSTSAFGGSTQQQQPGSTAAFGGSTNPLDAAAGGSSASPQPKGLTGLFGGGTIGNPPSGGTGILGGGLSNNQQSGGTGFLGGGASSNQQTGSTGLWGGGSTNTQQPANTGILGAGASNNQQTGSTGLWDGGSTNTQQPANTGILGAGASNNQQTGSTGLWGGGSTNPQQPGNTGILGGGSTNQQSGGTGLFGGGPSQQPSTGLWGGNTNNQQQQQPAQPSLFGGSTSQQPSTGLWGGGANNQQQQQPTQPSLFGGSAFGQNQQNQSNNTQPSTGLFGGSSSYGQQQQQQQTQPQQNTFGSWGNNSTSGTNSFLGGSTLNTRGTSLFGSTRPQTMAPGAPPFTKVTKFNDLPDHYQKRFEELNSYIQGRINIHKDLKRVKLGEEVTQTRESLRSAHKELLGVVATVAGDAVQTRDLENTLNQAITDTGDSTRIVELYRNPQPGVGYPRNLVDFPHDFFVRITRQMKEQLQWYKTTIDQIERKLASISSQSQQTPQALSATIETQNNTFMALAHKTALLHSQLEQLKEAYTRIWRAKTGSMRDPFNDLDQGDARGFGMENLK